MDIRYTAHGAFWQTEDDRPAAERTVSGGMTRWVVHDAQVVPRREDMLIAAPDTNDFSRWVVHGVVAFDPMMTVVDITLKMADGTLHRSAWEAFLRAVGDMEQVGLSPLGPVSDAASAREPVIHQPLSHGQDGPINRLGRLP